jgi:hypothetical protein
VLLIHLKLTDLELLDNNGIVNSIIILYLPCWLLHEEKLLNVSDRMKANTMFVERVMKDFLENLPKLEPSVDTLMPSYNNGLLCMLMDIIKVLPWGVKVAWVPAKSSEDKLHSIQAAEHV